MTANNSPAGAGNIQTCEITSNRTNKTVDALGGIVEYRYYESIMSNNISATMVMIENGTNVLEGDKGLVDGLPLRGGEKVTVIAKDSTSDENKIILEGTQFRVNRVRDVSPDTQKDLYYIDLSSEEYFINEKTRCTERFEGNISDHVRSIITEKLNSGQKMLVDDTAMSLNFYGNNRKPYQIITNFASKSVPTKGIGGAAGYLFFQTRDAMNFKSIDDLFSKEPVKKFIYTNTTKMPVGYDSKILSYNIDSDIDLDQQQSVGAYNNRTMYFDFYAMNYRVVDYNIQDQKKDVTTAGRNYINVSEDLIDKPSRHFLSIDDIGSDPKGSGNEQLDNWKQNPTEPNYKANRSMVQSPMRYNQLFTVKTNIVIPGDFSIKAGDIIECDFPQMQNDTDKSINKESGGKYMVAHVCHKITSDSTFTSMTLVRDSFGKNSGF